MSYYSRNPHYDRSDIDVDQADADEAAERHDAFLRKLVDDEYWHKVRGAKAIFNLEVSVATDKYPAGSPDLAAAFAAADRKFTAVIVEARTEKPARLAILRANDEQVPA